MSHVKQKIQKFVKSFHKNINDKLTSKYKKMDIIDGTRRAVKVSSSPSDDKSLSLVKIMLNLIHRFLTLFLRLILNFVYGEKGESMPPISDLTLLEPASSLAAKIRTRKIRSVDVIQSFIERIKQVNPILNCVVDERFTEALKEAEEADNLIGSGKYTEDELKDLKPFLGVPISTKDCIAVEGMLYTSGLYKRKDIRADQDAEAIALMRKAGAIPFALTNVSECCMWWESSNTVHGRTRNPYDTNRIVGGSSGGEGCIQGSAASPFGLGSDIGGSIRMPCFFNGIFGHKPSRLIVSNKGQFPMPFSDEQNEFLGIGPMSRFCTDLKPMLKVMAGEKAKILRLDEPVNLKNLQFFYQEDDGGGFIVSPVQSDIKLALRKAVKHLETVTNVKATRVQISKFRRSTDMWLANMKDGSGYGFDYQLGNLKTKVNPYTELVKWLFGYSVHTFIGLVTAIVEKCGAPFGSDKYKHFVKKRDELRSEIQNLIGENGILIYPTHPTAAPYHNEPIARSLNFSYTAIINVLGFPATAVPLGLGDEGLPIGVQVIANFNQDRLCLAVAAELERAFGGWVPPNVTA